MKKTIIALLGAFVIDSFAQEITTDILEEKFQVTLPWLEQKPKSYAKDFFIIQYLNQNNISIQDAQKAYDMARSKSSYINKAYKKYRKI